MNILERLSRVEDAERQQRAELATCYRLLANFRLTDLIYTIRALEFPESPAIFSSIPTA
jgi:hypothetical protein